MYMVKEMAKKNTVQLNYKWTYKLYATTSFTYIFPLLNFEVSESEV